MNHPNLNLSGIYAITHLPSGLYYVGSSIKIAKRWREHQCALRKGTHHAPRLQKAWIKDGQESFALSVLEYVADLNALISCEQAWIDRLRPCDPKKGFNMLPFADSPKGRKLSAEARAKMAAANRGRVVSAETREKLRAANKGRKRSAETRARMAAAQSKIPRSAASIAGILRSTEERKGQKQDPRTVAKRAASNRGKVRSEEARQKLAKRRKGCKASEETRANLRSAWERRKINHPPISHSADTKRRMSEAAKGRKKSEAHCAALSAAARRKPPMKAETRAKIGLATRMRVRAPVPEESKSRMRAAQQARWARTKAQDSQPSLF